MDYIELAIIELEKRSGISAGFARQQYRELKLQAGIISRPTPLAVDEATPCPVCGDDLFRCNACQEAHEKRLATNANRWCGFARKEK
jgi:hypothetical protein